MMVAVVVMVSMMVVVVAMRARLPFIVEMVAMAVIMARRGSRLLLPAPMCKTQVIGLPLVDHRLIACPQQSDKGHVVVVKVYAGRDSPSFKVIQSHVDRRALYGQLRSHVL